MGPPMIQDTLSRVRGWINLDEIPPFLPVAVPMGIDTSNGTRIIFTPAFEVNKHNGIDPNKIHRKSRVGNAYNILYTYIDFFL